MLLVVEVAEPLGRRDHLLHSLCFPLPLVDMSLLATSCDTSLYLYLYSAEFTIHETAMQQHASRRVLSLIQLMTQLEPTLTEKDDEAASPVSNESIKCGEPAFLFKYGP